MTRQIMDLAGHRSYRFTMKCEICKKTIQPLFLGKFKGTYVKDKKGKLHTVCFECQKKLKNKDKILKEL